MTSPARRSIECKRPLDRTFKADRRSANVEPVEFERVRHVTDTELLPKSNPEPVRRLEVFTGSGRPENSTCCAHQSVRRIRLLRRS